MHDDRLPKKAVAYRPKGRISKGRCRKYGMSFEAGTGMK
jgi:hypothetical protein